MNSIHFKDQMTFFQKWTLKIIWIIGLYVYECSEAIVQGVTRTQDSAKDSFQNYTNLMTTNAYLETTIGSINMLWIVMYVILAMICYTLLKMTGNLISCTMNFGILLIEVSILSLIVYPYHGTIKIWEVILKAIIRPVMYWMDNHHKKKISEISKRVIHNHLKENNKKKNDEISQVEPVKGIRQIEREVKSIINKNYRKIAANDSDPEEVVLWN